MCPVWPFHLERPESSKQLVEDPDINLQLSFWGSREVLLTYFPLAAFLNKSLLSKAVSCNKISIWSWELASCIGFQGWICSASLNLKTLCCQRCCPLPPCSCWDAQLFIWCSKHTYIKSKHFSRMTSKNYLLTGSCSFPPSKWGLKSTLQCVPMAAVPS